MNKQTIIAGLLLVGGIAGAVKIKENVKVRTEIAEAAKRKQRDLELQVVNEAFAKSENEKKVKQKSNQRTLIIENGFTGETTYSKIPTHGMSIDQNRLKKLSEIKAPKESMQSLKVKQILNSVHDPNSAYNRAAYRRAGIR